MRKISLLILCLSVLCFTQEARIMIVEKSDSTRLSSAYRDYQDAKARWESVKSDVAKKYTNPDGKKVIEGWEKVQFSADFRALVPESSQFASRTNCLYSLSNGTIFTGSGTIATTAVNAGGYITGDVAAQTTMFPDDLRVNSDGVAAGLTTKETKRP